MPRLPIGSKVEISWLDSVYPSPGWHYYHDDEQPKLSPRLIQTVGILVGRNPVGIVLAHSKATHNTDSRTGYLGIIGIPNGCILEMKPCG